MQNETGYLMEQPNIGQPSQPISKWLREFANDNREAANESFWPWARARFRGRAAAYLSAAEMIERAYQGNTTLPIRLTPGHSVELGVGIGVVSHSEMG